MEMSKGKDGWKALTIYQMGDAGADMHGRPMTREMHLETSKSGLLLVTMATVFSIGPTSRQHCFGFGVGGDFNRRITSSGNRCTEKTVGEQHRAAEVNFASLLADAHAHYAQRKNEAA